MTLFIPWNQVPTKYKYQAMDSDGDVYGFTHRPHPGNGTFSGVWDVDDGICGFLASFNLDTLLDIPLWSSTLSERPVELQQVS